MKAFVLKAPDDSFAAKLLCIAFALTLLVLGFCWDTPANIASGLWKYITSRSILLSDYFVLGSIGAAFVNAGIVMLMSIGLTLLAKTPFNGSLVAALFLMPGFAFFGKNPINILPFFLGVYLYARFQGEPMSKFAPGALYSTTLCPIVSDLMRLDGVHPVFSILIALAGGALIGFVIVPLAQHLFHMHKGYILFNYGFTSGILAYLYTSIAHAWQLDVTTETYWLEGMDQRLLVFLLVLCGVFLLVGAYLAGWRIRNYLHLLRYHGHTTSDYLETHGIGISMMNMGIVGLLCLSYIRIIGGDLSGPVMGAIFTAIGFAAAGIQPLNLIPTVYGVWLASSPTATAHATNPTIQLAALFGATALAPIAGEYGPLIGIIAGLLHFPLVYSTGDATGGFNLYNNGYAAGLVAIVLITLLHALLPRFGVVRERKIMRFLLLQNFRHPHAAHAAHDADSAHDTSRGLDTGSRQSAQNAPEQAEADAQTDGVQLDRSVQPSEEEEEHEKLPQSSYYSGH